MTGVTSRVAEAIRLNRRPMASGRANARIGRGGGSERHGGQCCLPARNGWWDGRTILRSRLLAGIIAPLVRKHFPDSAPGWAAPVKSTGIVFPAKAGIQRGGRVWYGKNGTQSFLSNQPHFNTLVRRRRPA